MERYNPDRSHDATAHLKLVNFAPEIETASAPEHKISTEHPFSSNRPRTPVVFSTPTRLSDNSAPEAKLLATIHSGFDPFLKRLARLKAKLTQAPTATEDSDEGGSPLPNFATRRQHSAPPPYLLPGTLAYLERLEHPPLLPAPRFTSFETAFRRHEPMFHTVFYRKYPPFLLDDAKQEGLFALFRKWLRNKAILDQSSSYVITAAIYGVSNWRQKGMKVRGNEGALDVDAHGKVIGEPHAHSQERWTDRIDRKLDVGQAVEVVLYQYEEEPDYREIYRVLKDVRDDVPFKQGQQASGLTLRDYKRHRDDVKARLRIQLAEYAPLTERMEQKAVYPSEPNDLDSDQTL